MITFRDYLKIINLAEHWILSDKILNEVEDRNIIEKDIEIYRKGKQFILGTIHSDVERDKRKWWSDYNDSNFTSFADKTLKALYDGYRNSKFNVQLNKMVNKNVIYDIGAEVAFVVKDTQNKYPSSEWSKGIVGSLRKSDNGAIDSYLIKTILNMEVMNQSRPLLTKETPTIELFNYKTKEEAQKEYEDNLIKMKQLEAELEDLELQLMYATEENDKFKIKKLKNLFDNKSSQLNNIKNKLTSVTESYIIKNKDNGRELIVFIL